MLMAHHLEKRWFRLYRSSLYRLDKLQPIKQKFAAMTAVEISGFWKEVRLWNVSENNLFLIIISIKSIKVRIIKNYLLQSFFYSNFKDIIETLSY